MVYIRRLFLSVIAGVFAGLSATFFLYALQFVTEFRLDHVEMIWLLPLAGLSIGGLYYYFGKTVVRGNQLILSEIQTPQKKTDWFMAPLILFTTLLTHLCGGSAGREGTAVQMGASLADQLGLIFKLTLDDRKILLISGMAAGFGAAVGAPLAGFVFGLEVIRSRKLAQKAFIFCFVASLVGYWITELLQTPHTDYPGIYVPPLTLKSLGFVVLAGVAFGSISHSFMAISKSLEGVFAKLSYPPLRPLIGGCVLVGLYWLEGSYRYAGLGTDAIQGALITPSLLLDPVYKIFFTALTVSSGFKGGEFIPLVFIGTTLGSSIGIFFPAYFSLAAGLGFASVFGAASKTPLACSIMAIEIFGFSIAPYIFISCFVASYINGKQSIYSVVKE